MGKSLSVAEPGLTDKIRCNKKPLKATDRAPRSRIRHARKIMKTTLYKELTKFSLKMALSNS